MRPARLGPLTTTRPFSTTPHTLNNRKRVKKLQGGIPQYPYPPKQWYKQSDNGLYGGKQIQFGNTVSEKNENKSRRYWKPNVHWKRIWSDSLARWIRTNVTTRALKTIDKAGGLDNYLLSDKTRRIKDLGVAGWLLRWRVMQTPHIKKKFILQRRALGLEEFKKETGSDGRPISEEELQTQVEAFDENMSRNALLNETGEPQIDLSGNGDEGFMRETKPARL
ncbi:MAG: 39S ribosomal protein L24, mitochondrial [Vezdaea aestivalis]|nr:MAG: 39S ribosomal protein L24, mitochondrial [Vezdaea aestivalis]